MKFISSLKKAVIQHKKLSVLFLLIIAGVLYFYLRDSSNSQQMRYVVAEVTRGNLVSSVSGTGQVSSSNQIDITSKASGELVYLNIKEGDYVKEGQLLGQIDNKEVVKNVRDAEISLQSTKLSLDKTSLEQKQQLRGDSLNKNYEDGMIILADLYSEFSTTSNALDKIFFGHDISSSENNLEYYSNYNKDFSLVPSQIQNSLKEINSLYKQSLADYQSAKRGNGDVRGKSIEEGYNLTIKTVEMIKKAREVVRYLQDSLLENSSVHDMQAVIDDQARSLDTYASSMDEFGKNLLSIINSVNSQKDIVSSYYIDDKSQALTLVQKQNALSDAKEKLSDYYIRAPFDGIIASLTVNKGDEIGSTGAIGTIITKDKIAEISLNEVDAAKIKIGQKATLTFDAIEDLTITGKVAAVDMIGTVSQGVVNYNIEISFDTDNDEIKPGMTVSASIITNIKQNVVFVPSSAVRTVSGESIVQMFDPPLQNTGGSQGIASTVSPENYPIEVGISDDTNVEIVSGLKEGQQIVVRTVSGAATKTSGTNNNKGVIMGRPF